MAQVTEPEYISPYVVTTSGGLVLDRDVYTMPVGAASILQNFEPSVKGGYRRIDGTTKYSATQVNGSNKVSGVAVFNNGVVAISGTAVKFSTGSTWSSVATQSSTPVRPRFEKYNFGGTDTIVWVDGANTPTKWTGTGTGTALSGTGAPANATAVAAFKNHLFYAGASAAKQQVQFTVPFDDTDYTGTGSGNVKVDTEVVALKSFRESLIIFGKDRIYKLTGSSSSDFAVAPVSRNIGCSDGNSVQEIGGDLIFLAPDGLRTVAGTARIGDVELGTVSKQIQERINSIGFDNICSTVIRQKSQYRLFYPTTGGVEAGSYGIIGVIKSNPQGQIGWEYSDLKGIKAASCDSDFVGANETVVHGGFDGFVYQQESGNDFSGTNIKAVYRSPDLTMGDAGIRKNMQRINLNFDTEGTVDASLFVKFDFEDASVPQPAAYTLSTQSTAAVYGTGTYGTSVYGATGIPIVRQSVEGSGFTVVIRVEDESGNPPITLKGFELEFTPGARM
tara:strand:- start:2366 stop:3877 length:1512 start_codon:yes stop_codon:yes gene_type:complete